jgi:hypothetical protein
MTETVFSCGSDSRLYNEDPMPAEIKLRESLEAAVENGNEFSWDLKVSLWREDIACDNYRVEIRCQDTTSEDWEP